jgi:hypothetical protein
MSIWKLGHREEKLYHEWKPLHHQVVEFRLRNSYMLQTNSSSTNSECQNLALQKISDFSIHLGVRLSLACPEYIEGKSVRRKVAVVN